MREYKSRAQAFLVPKPRAPLVDEECQRCGKITLRPASSVRKYCGDKCRFEDIGERWRKAHEAMQ